MRGASCGLAASRDCLARLGRSRQVDARLTTRSTRSRRATARRSSSRRCRPSSRSRALADVMRRWGDKVAALAPRASAVLLMTIVETRRHAAAGAHGRRRSGDRASVASTCARSAVARDRCRGRGPRPRLRTSARTSFSATTGSRVLCCRGRRMVASRHWRSARSMIAPWRRRTCARLARASRETRASHKRLASR